MSKCTSHKNFTNRYSCRGYDPYGANLSTGHDETTLFKCCLHGMSCIVNAGKGWRFDSTESCMFACWINRFCIISQYVSSFLISPQIFAKIEMTSHVHVTKSIMQRSWQITAFYPWSSPCVLKRPFIYRQLKIWRCLAIIFMSYMFNIIFNWETFAIQAKFVVSMCSAKEA